MEEVELSLVVFSYFRHYQEDKYEMKFREYISVAKHNINLLKSHMQLAWWYFFSEDTQHLEAAGTVMNGRQFARICWIKEVDKSRISKIERIGNKASSPTTRGEERMRKASVIRVINFIYQLQHDFIICCATEICPVTWLQILSAVNYTTFESLFTCAISEAFQLKSAASREPWQATEIFWNSRIARRHLLIFLFPDFCWPF